MSDSGQCVYFGVSDSMCYMYSVVCLTVGTVCIAVCVTVGAV